MLTGPLWGIIGLTDLANWLPETPGFILRFKRNVLKINSDSTRFIAQLNDLEANVGAQTKLQKGRETGIRADAATLGKTRMKAKEAGVKLGQATKSLNETDLKNTERMEEAVSGRKEGQEIVATMDAQAQKKQSQAETLAAAMQAWAKQHRQARLDALEQTRKRFVAMGYSVTDMRER
jgi:hypothetical protein